MVGKTVGTIKNRRSSRSLVIISLEKVILPGTWRYLGQRCPFIDPGSVPIAGRSPDEIVEELDGELYRIGRIQVRNAFLVVKGRARFLYVRPNYSKYRKVALRVFSKVEWQVDFDHALSRRIANSASPPYKYVLLLRVPPPVNRQHGHFEKEDSLSVPAPNICYCDTRVFDKWLARKSDSRRRGPDSNTPYSDKKTVPYGLTLKQKGRWAYAIGMGDTDLPTVGLRRLI